MNQVIPFNFEDHAVRSVVVDQIPWWVGKDVCAVLGYQNPNKAMNDHCHGVTKRYPIVDALGRTQRVRIINEPDIFRLIVHSKRPEAQRFEVWLFEEALPQIRRTGSYGTPDALLRELLEEVCGLREEKVLREENQKLRRRYKFTPDDVQEVLELHKQGWTVSQIADKTVKGRLRIKRTIERALPATQPELFDDEPGESFGVPLEGLRDIMRRLRHEVKNHHFSFRIHVVIHRM